MKDLDDLDNLHKANDPLMKAYAILYCGLAVLLILINNSELTLISLITLLLGYVFYSPLLAYICFLDKKNILIHCLECYIILIKIHWLMITGIFKINIQRQQPITFRITSTKNSMLKDFGEFQCKINTYFDQSYTYKMAADFANTLSKQHNQMFYVWDVELNKIVYTSGGNINNSLKEWEKSCPQ